MQTAAATGTKRGAKIADETFLRNAIIDLSATQQPQAYIHISVLELN